MIRVMMLAPVLVVLSIVLVRRDSSSGANGEKRNITIPWFAFLFLAVIGFNSLHLLPAGLVDAINALDTFLLTMAMTALGAESSFEKFKKAGARPFLLAGFLYIWLFFGGYWLGKLISFYTPKHSFCGKGAGPPPSLSEREKTVSPAGRENRFSASSPYRSIPVPCQKIRLKRINEGTMPPWDEGTCDAPHAARITPDWPSGPPHTDIPSLLSPLLLRIFPARLNKNS